MGEVTRITTVRITDVIKDVPADEIYAKEDYARAIVEQIKKYLGPDNVVVDMVQDFVREEK